MDEIIDSSSSDDERKAAILGAAHMIVEDTSGSNWFRRGT